MKYKLPIINEQLSVRKKGFTLIELMAVVAIITILAAIMIPNVVKHIERGKMGRATADIDILVKAVNLFQIDNERLPKDLSELWHPPEIGASPYISSDEKQSLTTPWKTTYTITGGSNSYTITAPSTVEGETKVSKTITFGSTTQP